MQKANSCVELVCGPRKIDLSRPHVMGVLNITPDSFSGGGLIKDTSSALYAAERIVAEGGSIVDVGGESTRPGADPVSTEQELDRVVPVVEAISRNIDTVVSVDTSSPEVMREACGVGACLINDVRALTREGAIQVVLESRVPVCLMHMQGNPETMQQNPSYRDVVGEVGSFLKERVAICIELGIPSESILIDPGIGFGKTISNNLQLLSNLDVFVDEGLPVLVGASRKSFIGRILNRSVEKRLNGSISVAAIAVFMGAKFIRAHDVAETVEAISVAHAIALGNIELKH